MGGGFLLGDGRDGGLKQHHGNVNRNKYHTTRREESSTNIMYRMKLVFLIVVLRREGMGENINEKTYVKDPVTT